MSTKSEVNSTPKVKPSKETQSQILWMIFSIAFVTKILVHLLSIGSAGFSVAKNVPIFHGICDHWLCDRLRYIFQWDGWYFFHIIFHGHTNMQVHAFYPGFPYLISFLVKVMRLFSGHPWVETLALKQTEIFQVMFTGTALNFVLYMANQYLIFKLALMRGYSLQSAKRIGIFFALAGPAFYHVVFYSESLYLFVALSSQFLIQKWIHTPKVTFSEVSLAKFLFMTALLAYSGFVRSIGLLNFAYIGYPLLIEFFVCFRNPKSLQTKGSIWVRKIKIVFRVLIALALFLAPTTFIVVRNRYQFCHKVDPKYPIPPFCHKTMGFFYSYIQEKFWNVYFLGSFLHSNFSSLVQILPALPTVAFFFLKFFRENKLKNLSTLNWQLSIDRSAIFDMNIRKFSEFAINLICCRVFYFYGHWNSVERFWVANYYFGFMLEDFQTWINLKDQNTSYPEKGKLPNIQYLIKYAKKIATKYGRYLVPANMFFRVVATPLLFSSSRIVDSALI